MAWKDKEKMRKYFRDRYATNLEYAQQYKLDKGCADCGYNEHHAGLEFDHIPELGGRLRGTVSSQLGKSMKVLKEEIARCEVVCGTCHNIRTYNRTIKNDG